MTKQKFTFMYDVLEPLPEKDRDKRRTNIYPEDLQPYWDKVREQVRK